MGQPLEPTAGRVLLRYKLARGVYAGRVLASSFPELIGMVEKDAQAAAQWKRKFVARGKEALKQSHKQALEEYKRRSDPTTLKHIEKDLDSVLAEEEKGLGQIDKTFAQDTALGLASSNMHQEYWDPEMFADGQTKENYGGKKPIEILLDVAFDLSNTYREFWKRFFIKYDIGHLNVTLLSLLPEPMKNESRVNMKLYQKLDGGDLEKALGEYKSALEKIMKDAEKYPGAASSMSIGVGLSALLRDATAKDDKWTIEFVRTLMRMNDQHKPFTPKQKALLAEKLQAYGIPAINHGIRY